MKRTTYYSKIPYQSTSFILILFIIVLLSACQSNVTDDISDEDLPESNSSNSSDLNNIDLDKDKPIENDESNHDKKDGTDTNHDSGEATQENAIIFTTEGSQFSPIITTIGNPVITWTFADGTTSNSINPIVDFGSDGQRVHSLTVEPWSQVVEINIGYDSSDGGSSEIPHLDNQFVSSVENLYLVAPYLELWCSSYNPIEELNFSDFIRLHTIEVYQCSNLHTVTLNNTPSLVRGCFEDCNLDSLDISQSPNLSDLRGATNAYNDIIWMTEANKLWHICIRDNPQVSNTSMFSDMSSFPNISELFIWNLNQEGLLNIPSTNSDSYVVINASNNRYNTLNLTGSLQNEERASEVDLSYNNLSLISIEECDQITSLNLYNNNLSSEMVDQILISLDMSNRSKNNSDSWVELYCDLSGGENQEPTSKGISAMKNLLDKGWSVLVTNMENIVFDDTPSTDPWSDVVEPNTLAGNSRRIYFATYGETSNMRCDFSGDSQIIWHWSNGTSTSGTSGESVILNNLDTDFNYHYLEIGEGVSVDRFGVGEAGQGNIVAIDGLNNFPELRILYLYQESQLKDIGSTNQSGIVEYHLMNTDISRVDTHSILADIVESGVSDGRLWIDTKGTNASSELILNLQESGWDLSFSE